MPAATIAAQSFFVQLVTFISHISSAGRKQSSDFPPSFNLTRPTAGAMIFRAEFLFFQPGNDSGSILLIAR
jgi:hypothetical protein